MLEPGAEIPRQIGTRSAEYLASLRVLVLNGPRQAGKTTLLNQLIAVDGGELRSLDDEAVLSATLNDPAGFVQSGSRPLCIDEVQRGGDALVRAVKSVVDKDRARGQFVLAGSTRFLGDPTLHESLAGRAGVLEVLPFSESELAGTRGDFLDIAFSGGASDIQRRPLSTTREEYLETMVRGGFPEVQRMQTPRVRAAWFRGYVQAVTDSDLRTMARINEPSAAGAVLRGLAALSGQQLVTTTLAERADLSRATVERYTELLEAVFLVHRLRPGHVTRSPRPSAARKPTSVIPACCVTCSMRTPRRWRSRPRRTSAQSRRPSSSTSYASRPPGPRPRSSSITIATAAATTKSTSSPKQRPVRSLVWRSKPASPCAKATSATWRF